MDISPEVNPYFDLERTRRQVQSGRHRGIIGGYWEEVGLLQFNYMRAQGLTPDMIMLDLGCGSLRGGVHFVDFLQPGHYFGVDVSRDLLDAGYDREIMPLGLQEKLPRTNLLCNGEFDIRFGVIFDIGIAVSLFTHMPGSYFRLCLKKLATATSPGFAFHVSLFMAPEDYPEGAPLQQTEKGATTFSDRNPYHYKHSELRSIMAGVPWDLEQVQDWGHPRNQQMAVIRRTSNDV